MAPKLADIEIGEISLVPKLTTKGSPSTVFSEGRTDEVQATKSAERVVRRRHGIEHRNR